MITAGITAIVVVHGSPAETVDACVTSLLASTDVDMHVVVVDNASPDGGAACVAWADVNRVTLLTSSTNAGFAAGVNIGLSHRRTGDLVWLLNDDATVAPDCISRCVTTLVSDPLAASVAPRVMLAAEPNRIDSIGVVIRPNGEAFNAYIGQEWTGQVGDGEHILGPCFAAALFSAEAFGHRHVGPIDERYHLYYEDIDWNLRAQLKGYHSLASTSAVAWHQHAASTRLLGEPTRYELVQRNLLLCVAKNFTVVSALRAAASRVVVHAKGVITGPLRMQRIRSMARAAWHLPSALLARRTLHGVRHVSDAELFSYAEGLSPQFNVDTFTADPNDPRV